MTSIKLAILIGGVGKRVGIEKPELRICGKKLLEIAVAKFSEFDPIFVCRDETQAERYRREFKAKFVCDIFRDFGAIAGIHSAIKYNGNTVVTAVDMPFVKKKVVEFLFEKGIELGCDALIPKHDFAEPLLAFYSHRALEEIERSIQKGERRILVPISRLKTIFFPATELRKFDKNLISFFNINTPENVARAEELCSEIFAEES
ncbi:MAG: molybdenum cofactor guanylyltransferase [Archaeoglobaceae archaeon]